MNQTPLPNETVNSNSTHGNLSALNVNNNSIMSVQQRLSQGGVGLFNQNGLMNGMLGNVSPTMNGGNLAGNMPNGMSNGMPNGMNNLGAMSNNDINNNSINNSNNGNNINNNNLNLGNAPVGGNINALPNMTTTTPAAANLNLNQLNTNDIMRLQQQMQQQQLQQQLMQQQQLQQMQLNTQGNQNMNLALMQGGTNNNLLQSLMGRNLGLAGVGGAQNPFFGQMVMNPQQQQQLLGNNGAAGMNSMASPNTMFSRDATRRMRGGVIEPFPEKLHRLLTEVEACGRADVISFVANGRAFAIHKADAFFKDIVPLYFRQSRLSSFKRQLNLYGFELINTGPARGGYYHELFVKERPELCRRMRRVAVKVAPNKDQKKKKKDEDDETSKPEESSEKSDQVAKETETTTEKTEDESNEDS